MTGNTSELIAHRQFLRIIRRGDGKEEQAVDAHWLWLRHNCRCCVHPDTGERIIDARLIPAIWRPAS